MKGSTFHPSIFISKQFSNLENQSMDVYERNLEWSKKSRKKVEQLRIDDKDKDLRPCTFAPDIVNVIKNKMIL